MPIAVSPWPGMSRAVYRGGSCPGSAANRASAGQTLTPFVGIARGMKYAIDGYRASAILVADRILKAAYQPPTLVLVDNGRHLGRAAERFHTRLDGAQELLPQVSPLTPYPAYAYARSCAVSDAMISSAARTTADPLFDFFPRESRGGVLHHVGFSPGQLFFLPVMNWYRFGSGGKIIP
jgi:hypothetical protein